MTDDLCADLDQLFLERRQQPLFLDRLGRRLRAPEIAEVVGERKKLKAHSVGGEGTTRHGRRGMTDTPQVLLAHYLKALKLPTFLREYEKVARQCAAEGVDHIRYLLRLVELELIERESAEQSSGGSGRRSSLF